MATPSTSRAIYDGHGAWIFRRPTHVTGTTTPSSARSPDGTQLEYSGYVGGWSQDLAMIESTGARAVIGA
jgi:hypothetical protein